MLKEPDPFDAMNRLLDKRESSQRKRTTLLSTFSIMLALIGAVASFFVTVVQKRTAQEVETRVASSASDEMNRKLAQQIAGLEAAQSSMRASEAALAQSLTQALGQGVQTQGGGLTPKERETLGQTENLVSQVDKRMGALESAILQTPEKAVALPLLKQQLTDLQEKTRGDIEGVRGEISRLYTMLQWLLGLMITIIIGVGGLIANSLRQTSDKKRDSTPETPVSLVVS